MAKSVKLQVLTPARMFYTGDIEMVIVKTPSGEEGFLANHAWSCKLLVPGELWIQEAGAKGFKVAALAGGFIDIKEDFIIYTDAAEWPEEIDTARAASHMEEKKLWLTEHPDDAPDEIAGARISVTKQKTRIGVAAGGARRRRTT